MYNFENLNQMQSCSWFFLYNALVYQPPFTMQQQYQINVITREKVPISVNLTCLIIFLIALSLFLMKCLLLLDNILIKTAIDLWGRVEKGTGPGTKDKELAKIENNKLLELRTKTENDKQAEPVTSLDSCSYNYQFRVQIGSSFLMLGIQSLSIHFFAKSWKTFCCLAYIIYRIYSSFCYSFLHEICFNSILSAEWVVLGEVRSPAKFSIGIVNIWS